MDAILIRNFGPSSVLGIERVPVPTPCAGQVVVKLLAVGVNPVEVPFWLGNLNC
jgi:NADPH:quinone reductase-like Zn-dependent oxidoreductase